MHININAECWFSVGIRLVLSWDHVFVDGACPLFCRCYYYYYATRRVLLVWIYIYIYKCLVYIYFLSYTSLLLCVPSGIYIFVMLDAVQSARNALGVVMCSYLILEV